MSNNNFVSHAKEMKTEFNKRIEKALSEIGMTGESFAKIRITEAGAIDTGRLRNSITWAIAGKKAHISSYKPNTKGEAGGTYDGEAPESKDPAVYIATNVVYAPGIETGSHRKKGAVHFLQDAAYNHSKDYQDILTENFKNF